MYGVSCFVSVVKSTKIRSPKVSSSRRAAMPLDEFVVSDDSDVTTDADESDESRRDDAEVFIDDDDETGTVLLKY